MRDDETPPLGLDEPMDPDTMFFASLPGGALEGAEVETYANAA